MVTTNVGALWSGLDEGSPLMPAPLSAPMTVRVWLEDGLIVRLKNS